MNQDQRYAPFRPELTAAHKERIRKAANQTDEYARIAIEEAKAQLSLAENTAQKRNALPDVEGVCLRIPNVDPRGQYSILDMRALQRIQAIDAVLNLRERTVSDLVYDILQGSAFQELLVRLQQTARRHGGRYSPRRRRSCSRTTTTCCCRCSSPCRKTGS